MNVLYLSIMRKILLLALVIVSMTSCKKEEQYITIHSINDGILVVNKSNTLRFNDKLIVYKKPTYECMSYSCEFTENGVKKVMYLYEPNIVYDYIAED